MAEKPLELKPREALQEIALQLHRSNQIAQTGLLVQQQALQIEQRKIAALENVLDLMRASQRAVTSTADTSLNQLREIMGPLFEALVGGRSQAPAAVSEPAPRPTTVVREANGTRVEQEVP